MVRAQAGGPEFDPQQLPWIFFCFLFFSSSWLTTVDEMKDLWCSSAINTDMNGKVCGALVQFGCYQHRHE